VIAAIGRHALLSLLALAVVACGSRGRERPQPPDKPGPPAHQYEPLDGPPTVPFDVDSLPQPVVKDEPLARYGNHSPYEVFGRRYEVLPRSAGYVERGIASWYGTKFHGRLTSTREPYDMYQFTAAHKTLPLPSYARVTRLDSGKSVVVRINDRGPFVGERLIDLSYAAAVKLGIHLTGTGPVEVRVLHVGDDVNAQRPAPPSMFRWRRSARGRTPSSCVAACSPRASTACACSPRAPTADASGAYASGHCRRWSRPRRCVRVCAPRPSASHGSGVARDALG
jgi:rare lipoprotein A